MMLTPREEGSYTMEGEEEMPNIQVAEVEEIMDVEAKAEMNL